MVLSFFLQERVKTNDPENPVNPVKIVETGTKVVSQENYLVEPERKKG
jgi:hypothetical protein